MRLSVSLFPFLHVFLPSFALVALGEIGDKTQLLSLALVCRFRRPWVILAAIICSTLINHGVSVWLGEWLAGLVSLSVLRYVVAAGFILLGLWMLLPDKESKVDEKARYGVFLTTFILFFLAEIGDKTQLVTVTLAAHYQEYVAVLMGTTLGIVAANAPVLWLGQRFGSTRWVTWAHRISALLCISMGVATLIW
jgi:putative Ca2+/H+ antiporter (TMEM165/GDT1 family)